MEQKFYKHMWENVLRRRFPFDDVEITSSERTSNGWKGTFTLFSRVIYGVENHYSFTLRDGSEMKYEKL